MNESDWLPGRRGGYIFDNMLKIFTETKRAMKLKLGIYVFYLHYLSAFAVMGTFKVVKDLQWEKCKLALIAVVLEILAICFSRNILTFPRWRQKGEFNPYDQTQQYYKCM